MKKPVIISIKGIQNSDDNFSDSDPIELITNGHYFSKGNNHYISYEETEMTGLEGVQTTVKVEGSDRVIITRGGRYKTQLILEKGKRHLCHYGTDYGSMMMGVNTAKIDSTLNETGGDIKVDYSLEINHSLASENRFEISVREANKTNDKSYTVS
jgi:uncharacterized beta-barrel protein YwiB (DUF1934 family)